MKDVFLLLGSNMGDRKPLIERSLKKITMLPAEITAISSLYESEPWGFDSENWFLNMAVWIKTEIEPHLLMKKLLEIEACLGRERKADKAELERIDPVGEKKITYCSRTIDIDILFYSDYIINSDDLQIPHPRLHLRNFALLPLAEIAGEFIHPVLKVTIKHLVGRAQDKSEVIRLNKLSL